MSTSLNLIIRDKDTGVVRTGLSVKLFNSVDGFVTEVLTAVELGGYPGVYQFTYNTWVNAKYKLKVNGTFDPTFGGDHGVWIIDGDNIISLNGDGHFDAKSKRLINLAECVDDNDGVRKIYLTTNFYTKTQSDDRYLQKTGGTMSGAIAMGSQKITELANAVNNDEALNKGQADGLYGKLVSNNSWSGASNVFTQAVTFAGAVAYSTAPPLCDMDPSNDNHLTRRSWVISQINNAAVPYQESVNVVRLVPEGSTQTGKVYTSWAAANAYLSTVASDLRRMTLKIEGAGTGGATIVPGDWLSYVSYQGVNQNLLLYVTGTNSQSATPGSSVISDCTIYSDDPDLEFYRAGYIFNNVVFDITALTSFELYDCELRNCILKIAGGVATYTNCKGSNNSSNTDLGDTIGGFGGRDIDDL